MPLPGRIKDIIPNVKWSRMVLSSIPSGKTPDSPAYSSYSLHAELAAANPDYSNLTIRQFPSWLRNPDHLADGQLSSASFAFEDPDGSLARRLIGTSLTAFGNLRCVIKPWAPPKKSPQGVRKLEHRSHFSLFLLTMDTLFPLSLTAFPFAYCLIDFILPSPLCSLRPVLQRRPTHRPQTHTDLTISPFPSVRDG